MDTQTHDGCFPVKTAAYLMHTSVDNVEEQISNGRIHPVAKSGELFICERDMYRLGALVHLQHTEALSLHDVDEILDRYVLPWSRLDS
jgi:hypothetical protein